MSEENTANKQPLIRYVNRQQMSWRAVDVEKLIGEDHPARAIWTLVGRLDLSPFYRAIESNVEEGGRPAFELQKWQERKSGEKAKRETRVSTSDPHARAMHQPDGGLALSYNAQISTDSTYGLIVGVAVTQEPNDSGQLLPAVDRVEQRFEKKPRQMVADSGYTTRENIEKMAEREIDFLGTMRQENTPRGANLPNRFPPSAFLYQPEKNHCICPEGKVLHSAGRRKVGPGMIYHLYEARLEDCQSCARRPECCPDNKKHGRSVAQFEESPVVIAFRKKMASEEARKQYRRRGRIVEFCHAWIKSKLGLRQFHVRGLKKVQMEMLWACLTYNLQHWIRLSKLRTTTAVT